MTLNEEHIDAYCEDIRYQVKRGIALMPLFCMTLTPEGVPAIDKAELLCRSYKKYKERLDACGVPSGALIQASIGHGWVLNADSAFQKFVGLADGKAISVCCPLDRDFQAYIRSSARKIASTHPDHIMLDDDFRLLARAGKGCACPLHMREFNRRAGTSLSREELYEILCQGGENAQQYREIFVQTQIDSLLECAREIRAGIDEVDRAIPGSFCLCGLSAEGAYEIATIMAGEGNPVILRVNNANYCATDPRNFAQIMFRASTQIAALRGKPDILLAETDTCPQNRYSTSAAAMHSHFTFTILEGAKGAKHWITRLHSFELDSGKAYRKKLEKYQGFYETLSRLNDSLTWLGCKIPTPSRPYYRLTPNDEAMLGSATMNVSHGWHTHILDRFGLPMHFANQGEGACFFSGGYDRSFSDEEMLTFLSGKVVLDAPAAMSLIERGFGKYLGVDVRVRENGAKNVSGELLYPEGKTGSQYNMHEIVILDEAVKRYSDAFHLRDGVYRDILFPSVTSYENELGGTVVVFAGNTSFPHNITHAFGYLNETRKKQMVKILEDLGALPLYYPDDAEVLCKAARCEDGSLLCAVLNMGLDPIEDLALVSQRKVSAIRTLTPEGEFVPVSFTEDEGRLILALTANTFEPVILILE